MCRIQIRSDPELFAGSGSEKDLELIFVKKLNFLLNCKVNLCSKWSDPGSRIRSKHIPDPGVRKATDHGSGYPTLNYLVTERKALIQIF